MKQHQTKVMKLGIRSFFVVYNNSGQVKRVSDLFDPEDESLQLIIVDRNQFPRTQNITYDINILRKLGLKSTSQLTGEDLLACAKYIHNNHANASERVRSDKLLEILQRYSSLLHGYGFCLQLSAVSSHLLGQIVLTLF
jgi:hypothetical protein